MCDSRAGGGGRRASHTPLGMPPWPAPWDALSGFGHAQNAVSVTCFYSGRYRIELDATKAMTKP